MITYLPWASARADEQGPHPVDQRQCLAVERNPLAWPHSEPQQHDCGFEKHRSVRGANVGENGVMTSLP